MDDQDGERESFRLVVPKHRLHDDQFTKDNHEHLRDNRDNKIKTTKYTIWSFIPKNLFEQFHRFANIYFLFIVGLNWVPAINAFGKEIAMLPLIFVLAVTAVKDLFEDRRRYNSDKKVNNTICQVYSSASASYIATKWKDVVVGDIIKLSSNEIIPADILLLNSSDENNICYVETANLDGETNLKQREVVNGLFKEDERFSPRNFNFKLKCETPNNHIYRFHGAIELDDSHTLAVGKENLLLRGCIVRNTKNVEGVVVYAGHDTKAMLNNSGPRSKHSKVERDLNLDVIACVVILFTLCFLGGLGCGIWTQNNDFFNAHFAPGGESSAPMEGFIRFWTFIIILQVLIPYSLYVSAELVKLGQVFLISSDLQLYHEETDQPVICRALNINEDLGQIKYVFSDKTGTLTENKMVFKKCTIGGVNYPHESAQDLPDAGPSDTEDEQYMQQVSSQVTLEKSRLAPLGFVALFGYHFPSPILSISCFIHCSLREMSELPYDADLAQVISGDSYKDNGSQLSFVREFFILLSICNTVVVNKHARPHPYQSGPPPRNTSEMHPSDKGINVRRQNYEERDLLSSPNVSHTPTTEEVSLGRGPLIVNVESGWVNNGLVPSPARPVQVERDPPNGFTGNSLSQSPVANRTRIPSNFSVDSNLDSSLLEIMDSKAWESISYEAESPDEAALVKMACSYGYRLLSRSPNSVTIFIPGEGVVKFKVLHVLSFDSTRKRMSVVVRRPSDGAVLMYCKGADSAVLTRLTHASYADEAVEGGVKSTLVNQIDRHLTMYARDGLRTLCMAKRELSDSEYHDWLTEHKRAETALQHRERLLQESAQKLESNMELLGATGIEDRLQDGVPETIAKLREGGLKVWVLTGDKQETAINVGYASKLLDASMQKITLNAKNKDECSCQIYSWLNHLKIEPTVSSISGSTSYTTVSFDSRITADQPLGLIIDGPTLIYALEKPLNEKFLHLASRCQVVLCCRATPMQKASVVELVRDGLKVMTLAIGDGANDVSMIQMADVGIGITGQEGMQAVMASDFAIARFRFLAQLLLVHGHWCYDRITKMILYFFYKNAMFVLVLFWYQLYNGFSGSNAIDDLSLIFFNLIFTAAPPIVCGILDKDLPATLLKDNPQLYKAGQEGQLYSRKLFWATILDALYQSVILFFACFLLFEGMPADDRMVGITMHQAAVVLASVHLGLMTAQWTWIHHFFLWGSVFLSFIWAIVFGVVQPTHKIHYVSLVTMATKEFWALCVMITVAALLPR
ncbi:predicted protein [Nematostella vectensis]|uniref:Phospholipid-transporting ATPase n=1 Tax=Nematostella vectensis TaxID=45351 RepID=A7S635_NEMVE|nr:predicted protein [Nematostella vectensis]|eukprot:XP_001632852.1 predicted protein [Nematostella vectensis]